MQPELPRRYPSETIVGSVRVGGIKRRLKPVRIDAFQFDLINKIVYGRQHDFRRKRQRRYDCPRCKSAVIGPAGTPRARQPKNCRSTPSTLMVSGPGPSLA